jgi:hypothetical protein
MMQMIIESISATATPTQTTSRSAPMSSGGGGRSRSNRKSCPTTAEREAETTDAGSSIKQSQHEPCARRLFSVLILLQVAAAATTTGFKDHHTSYSNTVSSESSVTDNPLIFLDRVDDLLRDLTKHHFQVEVNTMSAATAMHGSTLIRSFSFPDSRTMPSPRRVADPTGVYGPLKDQDGEARTQDDNNAMPVSRDETFQQFTVQRAKPKNRTESMIHSMLMENLPSGGSGSNAGTPTAHKAKMALVSA